MSFLKTLLVPIYTKFPENLEKRGGKLAFTEGLQICQAGTLHMIFYLFFIIILGNWDYKPHFINKEPKDTAAEPKFELS